VLKQIASKAARILTGGVATTEEFSRNFFDAAGLLGVLVDSPSPTGENYCYTIIYNYGDPNRTAYQSGRAFFLLYRSLKLQFENRSES
jgi:hypothetical protein